MWEEIHIGEGLLADIFSFKRLILIQTMAQWEIEIIVCYFMMKLKYIK